MIERSGRKTRIGLVISDKMDKTVVVSIENRIQHKVYKKIVKRSKKFQVHDDNNIANIGDKIKIMETRPISKNKRWRLVEVIEKAK